MAIRHVIGAARDKIKGFEGLPGGKPALTAYKDSGGVLTIGWGHTAGVKAGDKITAEQAEALLSADLLDAESAVSAYIDVPLNDNQFGALVSFTFNCGVGALKNSTLRKKLNAGDYASVPVELMKWTHDNGKVVQGLVNRRAAECGIWALSAPVSSAVVDVAPRPVSVSAKVAAAAPAIATASAAVAASAQTAAAQIQPLSHYGASIEHGFVGLTLVGIIAGAVAGVLNYNEKKATV